ncbi:MAG TPA: hypothetical protein VM165_04895 [Planctomycetaceae bacterium]|nr:hypothetical protein [Planctomycetaceae bacterium]
MSDANELPALPRKKKTVKKKSPTPEAAAKKTPGRISTEERVGSYAIGGFLFLLGSGLMVWFYYTQRAPSKLFNLLAAGGIASFLSGIGLFIYPLDGQRLDAFQNEPNPIAVFQIMPIFWKLWLLVILAAMIGAFIYVAQTTVRVG